MNTSTLHDLWQSPWLERVGWTLLHFLWQGTLVAAVLAAALTGLHGASARVRYFVSVMGAAAACLFPLLTFLILPLPAEPRSTVSLGHEKRGELVSRTSIQASPSISAPGPLPTATAAAKPTVSRQSVVQKAAAPDFRQAYRILATRARPWLPWCATLWAVGVAVLSLRLLAGWTQVQRLRRRGTVPTDSLWQVRLATLARRLGIRRTVRLLESTLAEVPSVVGWLRPIVLVPVSVLTGLSTEQVEMILAHELAHVRRQDYLVNLGLTLFETFGFYHPAVWWIARCVRAEREHACDDLAVSICGGDRLGYVRALATLEEMRGPAGPFALAASSGGRGLLLARVRRLLGVTPEHRPRTGRTTWWLAGAIALLAAFAITLGGMQRSARAQETPEKQRSAGEQLRGLVVDESGKPVPGAWVYDEAANDNMDPGLKEPVLSGADGSFRVPKLRDGGHWRVIAARLGDRALGWLDIGHGLAPAAIGADNTIPKPIVLRARRYRLSGVCVDDQGQPVTDAQIAVTSLPTEGGGDFTLTPNRPEVTVTQFFDALTARSDAQGKFSLTVPVNGGLFVEISAPGRQTVEPFSEVKAGEPEVGDLGRITLKGAGAIAGRIAFAEGMGGGRSLKGMNLVAIEAGELRAAPSVGPPEHTNEMESDEAGNYRIEHLPPGTYTVYLFGIDHQAASDTPTTVIAAENVAVRAGETTPLDLRAVVGRRLIVRAFDADTDRPVTGRPGVHIEGPSQPRSAGVRQGTALTEQGEWWFDVAPGHYRVFLATPTTNSNPETASAEVDVPADRAPEPALLKVTDRQQHLLGHVQDAQGKPVPLGGASDVVLFGTNPKWDYPLGGSMSSDGTFRIDHEKQAGGRVRVAVDVPGYRLWLSPEFVLTDHPEPVMATLEPCVALTVRGRALDQNGQSVARAEVIGKMIIDDGLSYQVRLGSGIPSQELFTDADGRFETRRFRAGDKFRLFVDRPGMSIAASADEVQADPSSAGIFNVEMHPLPETRPAAPDASKSPPDPAGQTADARSNHTAAVNVTTNHHADTGTAGPTVTPLPKPAAVNPASPFPPDVEMLTTFVKVVDEDGKPINGATVTPDGLRTRANNGSHYSWVPARYGKPTPALTDANGIAAVLYPRYTEPAEKLTTGAISFRAEHPDDCPTRPTNYAVVDDPAKAEPVVLRRGVRLRITGHLPGSAEDVPVFPTLCDLKYDMLSSDAWKDVGVNGLETSQLWPGRSYVRLAHAAADGTLFFSDTKLLSVGSGQTYTLDLELKPGVRVEGLLDASVPRPVRGGRVVIYAYATAPESDAKCISWNSWRDVATDGTFVFEALPPGELAVTALCDGYTSVSLPDTRFGWLHIPQTFELRAGQTTRAEIKMQTAATCEVHVRDASEAPVSGAHVEFAPNVQWVPGLTSIFCCPVLREEEMVSRWRTFQPPTDWFERRPYQAVTDARGIATVHNLPALRQTNFGVSDDRYEAFPPRTGSRPGERQEGRVNLVSDETAIASARLEKKGTHPPREEVTAETLAPTPTAESAPKPRVTSSSDAALAVHTLPDAPDVFSGRVVDPDGKPLPGVLVDAWTWCPGAEATTDADGNFQIKGLEPKRQIEVRFSKEGYTPRLVVRQPLGAMEQPLALTNQTYFEGVVTGPDGQPADGAWIRANQGPKDADGVRITSIWTETHADAQGHYRLYAQDDRYDFQVTSKEGSVARLSDTDLAEGQARRLDIAMQAGVVFHAKVVDSRSGAPVAGVKLSNWQQPGTEGVSATDGTLEIRGLLPGKFEWDVAAEGYARWWSEQCVSEESRFQREFRPGSHWQRNFDGLDFDLQRGMTPVTITVERGVRLRGRALDPDGKPIAGATVAPAHTGTGNSITGDTRYSVETRGDGAFEMLLPASGEGEYNLEVHDGKYGEWRQWANGVLPPIHTQPGQQIDGIEIRLSRPATVRGRVLDAAGEPLAGRDVRAQAADRLENRYYDPTVTTDRIGRFELKSLRPGKQFIQVEPFWLNAVDAPAGTSQTVDVIAGSVGEEIELRDPSTGTSRGDQTTSTPIGADGGASPAHEQQVRGFIHDADGNPVAGAEIEPIGMAKGDSTMYGLMRGKIDEQTTTDAKGEFVLRHADSDAAFILRVSAPCLARAIFTDLKPTPEERTLILKRGAVVTGQILSATGSPAAGLKLTAVQTDRNVTGFLGLYQTLSDAQGRFRFDGLGPAQTYDLFSPVDPSTDGDVLSARAITAGTAGSIQEAGVWQMSRGLHIRGQVRLADGKLLPPGSFLSLNREHAWGCHQRVDLPSDGKFAFEGVPAEAINFTAHVPGYDNLMERTKASLRSRAYLLERNPASLLRDVAEYERSGRNWQLQVAGDTDDLELLLHPDAAIDHWIAAQSSDWIQRIEADYPQGTAGMGRIALRDLALQAQKMIGTPDTGLDPHLPVTWRFVLSSEQESALAEVARRAKALGFEVHATGKLTDLEQTFGLPPDLRTRNTDVAPLLALELRLTELPAAELLFQHELALRRLMHESGLVHWQGTGRVLSPNP